MVPSDRMFLNDAVTGRTWRGDAIGPRRGNGEGRSRRSTAVRHSVKTRVTMSLNLEQKQAVVAEVAKQVAGAQAIVMAENRGCRSPR